MVDKVCCILYSRINDEVNFLIMHRNNWWNGWELIRGDINEKESAFAAALRVVNEETKLNIEKVTPLSFSYSYDYMKELSVINVNVSCFAGKSDDLKVMLSSEHNHYKWVNYDDAKKMLDFDEQKKLLEFFIKAF